MMRFWLWLWLALALACTSDDDTMMPADGGIDSSSEPECERDSDCDDSVFCNGEEICDRGECESGDEPCDGDMCVEAEERCESGCIDADGDGRFAESCGGDDCDDDDPNRYPGNPEVCDANDHDEDCDDITFGFRDVDMDGFPDINCCNGENCGSDCDDAQPAIHPSEAESCDGLDNDCDSMIDETVARTFYADTDGDTFGDPGGESMVGCNPPDGFVENDDDCDDSNSQINPLANEICDPTCMPDGSGCIDENCDGEVRAAADCDCSGTETRSCLDTFGICASGTETCIEAMGIFGACSVAPQAETCNMIDDDCDGEIDNDTQVTCYQDMDGDGYAPMDAEPTDHCQVVGRDHVGGCPIQWTNRQPTDAGDTDCDDTRMQSYPGASEICDRLDNDCSSGGGVEADEDMDNDGYAPLGASCMTGFPRSDCDDNEETTYPTAIEYCDRVDSDCSSGGGVASDEDDDNDGHAPMGASCVSSTGAHFPKDDCNDFDSRAHPGVPNTTWFDEPMTEGCVGDSCWDFDCNSRVLKEFRQTPPTDTAGCQAVCNGPTDLCAGSGFVGGPDGVDCGDSAPFAGCAPRSCSGPCTFSSMGNRTMRCR